ncbi:MAG: hypothetical protein WA060_00080 [Minisyncoccia bacterium]
MSTDMADWNVVSVVLSTTVTSPWAWIGPPGVLIDDMVNEVVQPVRTRVARANMMTKSEMRLRLKFMVYLLNYKYSTL